jgi:hypothetical protein
MLRTSMASRMIVGIGMSITKRMVTTPPARRMFP